MTDISTGDQAEPPIFPPSEIEALVVAGVSAVARVESQRERAWALQTYGLECLWPLNETRDFDPEDTAAIVEDIAQRTGLDQYFGVDGLKSVARCIAQGIESLDRPKANGAHIELPLALADDEPPPVESFDQYGVTSATEALPADSRLLLPALQWLDMSNWDHERVPDRQWAIRDRVPLNQAGLFSGEGGTGKSIVELMKNVAHVTGKDWLGSMPEPGPAIYVGAEDDEAEIHIRLAAIAEHYGATFRDLTSGGLHILPLLGQDATLCAVKKSGKIEVTNLYRQIHEAAGDIKPKNISIDTLSRAFAGNEIDRTQVYAFAMHMQALAKAAGGSVTVLSHPSLAGISTGSGISGSTAWHGAFRFRQYLKGLKADAGEQPDNDLRQLEFKKNQYGPIGETIALRYQGGLFLPVGGSNPLDKIAAEQRSDEVFLQLLAQFAQQGRNVSQSPTANSYAPTAFAKEEAAKAKGIRKPDFDAAMRRLFDKGKLRVEQYGRPSRPASRLAATGVS